MNPLLQFSSAALCPAPAGISFFKDYTPLFPNACVCYTPARCFLFRNRIRQRPALCFRLMAGFVKVRSGSIFPPHGGILTS